LRQPIEFPRETLSPRDDSARDQSADEAPCAGADEPGAPLVEMASIVSAGACPDECRQRM